jgi:gamma-glutamyl-gamma-aminobutyrate hydrolase PuuD
MRPRIAIPLPHSTDLKYGEQALPQYLRAIEMAGGEPVRVPLDQSPAQVMELIEGCDGVLLPGSNADVDPAKFDAEPHPKTAAADPRRDTVDELLLDDAYNMRKPVLGICYGLQILNVYRSGTLLQHIESPVNHEAGRKVAVAHVVEIEPQSRLAEIVASGAEALYSAELDIPRLKPGASTAGRGSGMSSEQSGASTAGRGSRISSEPFYESRGSREEEGSVEGHGFSRATQGAERVALAPGGKLVIPVNSSHHQSAEVIGDSLRVVARCPEDGVIEAVEGTSPDHFVLAVQWHPERSTEDEDSRAIFSALIEAAKSRHNSV